jgi:hypothetical protein
LLGLGKHHIDYQLVEAFYFFLANLLNNRYFVRLTQTGLVPLLVFLTPIRLEEPPLVRGFFICAIPHWTTKNQFYYENNATH